MTPHERFVHFVVLFLGSKSDQMFGRCVIEEALGLASVDESLGLMHEFPMAAAWEFVQYKNTGAGRPAWLPPRLPSYIVTPR